MTTNRPKFRTRHDAIRPGKVPAYKDIARLGAILSRDQKSAVVTGTSDEALLKRIAAGDGLAMHVLFGRHHVRVYRFALRLVGNTAVAEDLTSEVFLSVWRHAGRFEGRSAVSTWLLGIARFKAFSALRRRPEEELSDETAGAIEDLSDDPQLALEKKDKSALIRKCLTGLTPEHREIIDLVYYHEKSIQEVADIIGIPLNTVKTRTYYARRKLSELLQAAGITGVA